MCARALAAAFAAVLGAGRVRSATARRSTAKAPLANDELELAVAA